MMSTKQIVALSVLIGFVFVETWHPFFTNQHRSLRHRLRHDAKNFFFGGLNALLSAAVVGLVFCHVDQWATTHQFGVLRQWELPAWLKFLLAILTIDLGMYWWHRLNHRVPLLWRFHRVHHGDTQMNASTGIRFHLGEVALSWLARILLLPLLGVRLLDLAVYESLALPVVVFHHANIKVPREWDRALLSLVVTPAMHRVHHSRVRVETNSNYSSLLSCWDRLFCTMQKRKDLDQIEYGLEEELPQSFVGMAVTPLLPIETEDQKSSR